MNEQQPKISRLLNIDPELLTITALWTNQEVRLIDFVPLFAKWKREGELELLTLSEANIFSTVSLSKAKTLQWKTVQKAFIWKGETRYEPIELDPYVLFDTSTLVKNVMPSNHGASQKSTLKKAAQPKQSGIKKPVGLL